VADAGSQPPKDLIGFLDFYLVKKAPFQIPEAGRQAIVQFGPWIAVVLLALSAPLVFALLGLSLRWMPTSWWGYYAYTMNVAAVVFLIHFALTALALPGLFARKMSGWTLLFYAQVVNVVSLLLWGAILNAIVTALVSFYILFQVRTLYR
jgi:hypothetical protein